MLIIYYKERDENDYKSRKCKAVDYQRLLDVLVNSVDHEKQCLLLASWLPYAESIRIIEEPEESYILVVFENDRQLSVQGKSFTEYMFSLLI